MQIHAVAPSPLLVSHLLLLSSIICGGSGLVIRTLTIRRADNHSTIYPSRIFVRTDSLFGRRLQLDASTLSLPRTWCELLHTRPHSSSVFASRRRARADRTGWRRGGLGDDTKAHECHTIHQPVTGCRPSICEHRRDAGLPEARTCRGGPGPNPSSCESHQETRADG